MSSQATIGRPPPFEPQGERKRIDTRPIALPRRRGGPESAAPASAIYEGWVTHRRAEPVEHYFRYRVFMPLFDLGELPDLLDIHPLWSARRPALARIRRGDYLPERPGPLAEAARSIVASSARLACAAARSAA